jgi:drug/metabolite transporter (DMT)-like permease
LRGVRLAHIPRLGAKTLGVLAVIGLVVGFSMSSTLAKKAESPGVLIAFWRMIVVSIVWSLLLAATGRRVRMVDVRQVFIPGIFFGLNLAVFFTGVTHNSVANAALIGSLAPFLIVPLGAWLFRERFRSRALVFAAIAFCGVAVVLFNAPPIGDASLEGNLLGLLAMFLLVGYVVSTRHFRRDMDVTTFMATICPIAAVAVLPVALAHGDVTGLSATGWKYMLILTFTSGIVAQGLLVYAQRTVQIGTIGIAQELQPALAVVWSVLILGETVNGWQMSGIATVVVGLVGFVVMHQRSGRPRADPAPPEPAIEPGTARVAA